MNGEKKGGNPCYRYYSIEQLETMLFINRLKSYNFSLEEIKEILDGQEVQEDRLYSELVRKKREIEEQKREFERTLGQLSSDILTLKQGKSIMSYLDSIDVRLVEVPKMYLLSIRKMVHGSYSNLSSVYTKQREWAEREGYECNNALYEVYVTDPTQAEKDSDYSNIAGMVVLKDGKTRYENYFNGCTADSRIHIYSVTKSIVSVLIGIALDKGYIKSVNQKVLYFFPDYTVKGKEKTIQNVTLRNLLTMTAPYKYNIFVPSIKYFTSDDWVTFTLDLLGGACVKIGLNQEKPYK